MGYGGVYNVGKVMIRQFYLCKKVGNVGWRAIVSFFDYKVKVINFFLYF